MDRQEYREIIGEIKAGYKNRDYERVIAFARELPIRKIKENSVIEMISTAYDQVGKPALARTTLETAYKRMPGGKQTAYKLAMLALKTDDVEGAVGYYEDFCRIAPNDNQRFILKYEIAKEGGLSVYDKIRILEEYTAKETDDKWMYELAHLYHEAGMGDKCAEMCDEIVVWFSDGDYLKRALELKFAHKALSPTQQAMYERIMQDYIEDYEEPEPVIEEPSMSEEFEAEAFAKDFLENVKDPFADTKPIEIPEEMLEHIEGDGSAAHTKKLSLSTPSAKEPEDSKNIFYDFRIEEATLNPNPELDKWLASLPDIKEINKPKKEIEKEAGYEESPGEDEKEEAVEEKIFADIPAYESSTDSLVSPGGTDAVLENLSVKDEKIMAEVNTIFNESVAESEMVKTSFDEELQKSYSPALESIKETPILEGEFDRKKVEIEEGQIGINLDLLKKDDKEVEGQLSIDQLFQAYANNIENNLENKAAVAKVEAERLKQIREAVEKSMPEAPAIDFEDESPEENITVQDEEKPFEAEKTGVNEDSDMDEDDRWKEDPVDKILNEFVASQPVPETAPEEPIISRPKESADIEIPDFLKNLQFNDTDEEDLQDVDFSEKPDETEVEESLSSEPEEFQKTEEEELDELEDFLVASMGRDFPLKDEPTEDKEEITDSVRNEEEVVLEEVEEEIRNEDKPLPEAESIEEEFDDELDEFGDALADIFGEDTNPEAEVEDETAVEEKIVEKTEEDDFDLEALIDEATEEIETEKIETEEIENGFVDDIADEAAAEEITEESENITAEGEKAGTEDSPEIEAEETVEEETPEVEAELEITEETPEAVSETEVEEDIPEVEAESEITEENSETSSEIETKDETEVEENTAEKTEEEDFDLEALIDEATEEIENEEVEEIENRFVDDTADEVAAEDSKTGEETEEKVTKDTSEAGIEGFSEEEELNLEALIDEVAGEVDIEGFAGEEETGPEVRAESPETTEEAAEVESTETDTKTGDTQEIEKVYKFALDSETKEEIAEFLLIEGMGEKITNTVDNIILTIKSGKTTGGNLIITGDAKTGKTFLAISIIKAVNKELKSGSGKVAKVQSESLNGKDIEKVFQKIDGNDLIIENVGYLDEQTISDIIDVMQSAKFNNLVVFEGNMLAVETIVNKHPEVEKLFENRLDISELSITQWADVACDYAKRKGYKVSDMALLALHAKIDEINLPTSRFGYEDIVNIMETAIEKCEKRNTGKLFSAFSRKEDEYIELNESDFV